MPKAKRDKVVHLSKTKKKTADAKLELVNKVRKYIDAFQNVYVF
jgi:hypothetical protein